jgi:hypothetical protein
MNRILLLGINFLLIFLTEHIMSNIFKGFNEIYKILIFNYLAI